MIIKSYIHSLIILLFWLLTASLSFGQEANSSSMGQRFISDVEDAYHGAVHVFSRPLYWQGDDWLNFGYVMTGTAAISLLDKEVRNIFRRNQSNTGDALAEIGEVYGEPLTIVMITGGIYIFGNIFDDQWARETAVIMTAAILPGGIYQTTAKICGGRARPYMELGNYYFDPFRRDEDYYSFVSGHTMVAIGTSLILARRINNSFIKATLYSLGALGGLSRLYSDDHWLSDVVLGGALAFSVSQSASGWLDNNKTTAVDRLKWLVTPFRNGVNLTVRW